MSIVSCRYGKFSIPDRDDLVLNAMRKYGEWAQQEIDVLARFIHPGDTVIDAGAFVGTHARAFSQIVGEEGKVIAFEPNPTSYEYLSENANLAQYANITTYQIALGDRLSSGGLSLVQPEQNLGGTKISEGGTDANGIVVRIQCLDDFDFGKIDFIKADIEGMEFPMLLGAEKTVSRDHPVIFLEVNNLQASIPVLGWASARDYMIFGLISAAFNPDNFNGVGENIFGEAVECGLLLIHRTELAAWESVLSAMNMPAVDSADSLALLLLHKPQYFHEVLEKTSVAKSLGLDVPTPLVRELVAQVAERDAQIVSLNQGFASIEYRIKQLQTGFQPNAAIMDVGFSSLDQIVSNESGFFSANSLEERYDSIPMRVPDRVESSKQLLRKLEEHLLNDDYVISISHDNYVQSTGGVQIKISDEQVTHNSKGIGYLHLYPYTPKPTLVREHEPFYIGINCNGRDMGVSDGNELMTCLMQLTSLQKKLINVYIHHTMGFNIYLIYRILNELGNNKARFWLHDNFSLCPSYYLLRNDAEYCGAPDMESNACFICLYGEIRQRQQSAFLKLFEDNDIEVVAPSNYELIFWKEKFPYIVKSEKVLPHAKLIWGGTVSARPSNDPIRIGFVGFPVYHKGWQTWLRLINSFSDGNRYRYFLFSSISGTPGNYTSVNVTTTKDKRFSMVKALKAHKIDVAFLWSLCPETFSFTLYESLASGCFILTNKNSGNIQDYIRQNPNRGLILNDKLSLYELFSGNDLLSLVRDYQKNGVPQGKIILLSGIGSDA